MQGKEEELETVEMEGWYRLLQIDGKCTISRGIVK